MSLPLIPMSGIRRKRQAESPVETLEQIKARAEAAIPGVRLELLPDGSPGGERSLLVDNGHGFSVAKFLRDDPALLLDHASNMTGVDWPELVVKETVKSREVVDGVEKQIARIVETRRPGYLEAVYHLYSMTLKHGPVILRLRTVNRTDNTHLPSLTPLWRGLEFQEREAYDLYGILFDGHPDLRRILMWDGFKDYPMRKDYVEPDDYEYEPTAHGAVAQKARVHNPPTVAPLAAAQVPGRTGT